MAQPTRSPAESTENARPERSWSCFAPVVQPLPMKRLVPAATADP